MKTEIDQFEFYNLKAIIKLSCHYFWFINTSGEDICNDTRLDWTYYV